MVNELKGVIRKMTASESSRHLQHRLSAAHYRPDSVLGPSSPPTRPIPDALVSQVGAALTLETPRGRFRSMVLDRMGATGALSARTTLADDLGAISAKSAEPCNGQQQQLLLACLPPEMQTSSRGTLLPPATTRPTAARTDNDGTFNHSGSGGGASSAESRLEEQVRSVSEAMEIAFFQVEDNRGFWERKQEEMEANIKHLKQLLMEAQERILAVTAEVEGLRDERIVSKAEQKKTQQQLEIAIRQLRESAEKVAKLQAALEAMQLALGDIQKEVDRATHLSAPSSASAVEKPAGAASEGPVASNELKLFAAPLLPLDVLEEQESTQAKTPTIDGLLTPASAGEEARVPSPHAKAQKRHSVNAAACLTAPTITQPCLEANKSKVLPLDAREGPQLGKNARVEKLKVVFKRPSDCCSPMSCLTLWYAAAVPGRRVHSSVFHSQNTCMQACMHLAASTVQLCVLCLFACFIRNATTGETSRIYALEPSEGAEAGMWSSRKPRIVLRATTNTLK